MSRKNSDFDMVKPNWIKKLLDSGLSSPQIGELIGKSNQYVNHCLTKDSVQRTSEIAAEFIWQKKFGIKTKADKTKVCLVTIDSEHTETIKKMVEAFGGAMSVCEVTK